MKVKAKAANMDRNFTRTPLGEPMRLEFEIVVGNAAIEGLGQGGTERIARAGVGKRRREGGKAGRRAEGNRPPDSDSASARVLG
jgi:hypothetical protein